MKATETLTVIMGAAKNGKIIATYDWTRMLYQEVVYTKDRYMCSCGLLKQPNGQILVAIAGRIQNKKIARNNIKSCFINLQETHKLYL